MYIKKLKIDAFGTLRNREITLTPGLNIIEGANESGKSATAMFIKFMLYGLSGKSTGGELTERRRYVNWDTGTAGGTMTVVMGDKEYRIERLLAVATTEDGAKSRETVRETVRIIDPATNTQIHKGEVPGEVLLGVPENIFMNTVFVRQLDGTKINGAGMLTSIENLLFTADETVGTKKALERLEDARRQILHKNGSGGLLSELRAQRSEAAAALREAQTRDRTLVGSEAEWEEAKAQCELLAEKISRQEAICRCGAVNTVKKDFDKLSAGRKKLQEMENDLSAATATGIDRTYLADLAASDKRIRLAAESVQKLTAAKESAESSWKEAVDKETAIRRETEDATTLASSLQLRMRTMTAAACALFFFTAVVGLIAWFCYSFSITLYTVPIVISCVLAAIGVLCLVLRGKASRQLQENLSQWEAVSAEAIPAAIAGKYNGGESAETLRAEKQQLEAALAEAISQRREAAENGYDLAARADASIEKKLDTDEEADVFESGALAALAKALQKGTEYCQATEALRRETDALRGRLSLLEEQLSGEDEAAIRATFAQNMNTVEGRIASGIDAPRLETAQKELERLKDELAAARESMHRMEPGIAAARAVTVSPAEITEKIDALDTEIEELSIRHEAYCLAIDTLKSASDSMRASVLPRVIHEACASANRIAGGSFEAIGVDETLNMSFTRNGQTREVEYLSEGTKDLSYISLRRALTGVLMGGIHPPLIYDESFSRLDETRLARILALLSQSETQNSQSILLTCHKIEAEIAARSGGANLVRL